MNNSIENSILACQSGDPEAIAMLYEQFVDKIYAFVYYRTLHQQIAEDITSVTFVKVLESIGSYSKDSGTVQAWIYTIARNTLTDYYRTKRQEYDIMTLWDKASEDDIESMADINRQLDQVKHVLLKMKPEQQEILLLRLWDGLSYKEIATVLGKSEAAAKMSFTRAVRALREQISVIVLLGIFIKHFSDRI